MIEDLRDEGRVVLRALIARADQGRTNKNALYLSLQLEDASGTLDAKFWNLTPEQVEEFQAGQVAEVKGDLMYYRNARQLRVLNMKILPDENVVDYVKPAPLGRDELQKEIYALLEDMDNVIIEEIVRELLEQNKEAFFAWPAAVKNHHSYASGLAWHTLSMARLAKDVLALYPFLDYNLVMAGIILHDMGKIVELSAPVLPEYTPAGNLLGHISIMNNLIDRVACSIEEQDSEEVMLLKHMVLSHHGKLEYGSPVLPMIPEAEVVTLLDNLDARMVMMKQSVDETLPGQFGPRNFALDNRMMYRRKSYQNPDKPEPELETEAVLEEPAQKPAENASEHSEKEMSAKEATLA